MRRGASLPEERKNITWTEEHDRYIKAVYEFLKERGIVLEWKGEPNASAIILYALKQAAKRKRKAEKGDRE